MSEQWCGEFGEVEPCLGELVDEVECWWGLLWLGFGEFGEVGDRGVVLDFEVAELLSDVFDGVFVGVVVEDAEVADESCAGVLDAGDGSPGGVDLGLVFFGLCGVGGLECGEE